MLASHSSLPSRKLSLVTTSADNAMYRFRRSFEWNSNDDASPLTVWEVGNAELFALEDRCFILVASRLVRLCCRA